MNNRRLKQEVESIRMPEEMKERILANCREKTVPVRKKKSPWKVVLVAAILVVCAVPVLAGQGETLQLPTLLADDRAVQEEGTRLLEDQGSYSVSGPNSRTPHSLEEMTESRTFKWEDWTSEDNIDGTVVTSMNDWVGMKVLEDQGPVKVREVYEKGGGVKTEYAAQDPTDLQNMGSGYVTWDLTWMNDHYDYVPGTGLVYVMEDRWGNLLGEYGQALYATEDRQAWFSLAYEYDSTWAYDSTGELVAESSYDRTYQYTTAQGHTFLLRFYGDCVWAECTTTYTSVSLYGGYLEPEKVEELLDNLGLTIGGNS